MHYEAVGMTDLDAMLLYPVKPVANHPDSYLFRFMRLLSGDFAGYPILVITRCWTNAVTILVRWGVVFSSWLRSLSWNCYVANGSSVFYRTAQIYTAFSCKSAERRRDFAAFCKSAAFQWVAMKAVHTYWSASSRGSSCSFSVNIRLK